VNPLKDLIDKNRAWYCLDCGKCSAVCPITRFETKDYASPRLLVEKAMDGKPDVVWGNVLFWSCLTCKRCSELCPSDVRFSEFIRDARHLARKTGRTGSCTHGEVIQTWGRIMTDSTLRQNRLGWIGSDLTVSEDSDTVLFVGCAPHYDTLFRHLNAEGVDIARAALRILNHLGIAPQVMADERCCGHDQLWEGDFETFSALARNNLERLKSTGAKQIVTACPECARTLKVDYPQLIAAHGMRVLHISELMVAEAETGRLHFTPSTQPVSATYQDPCRLGRHLGIYDQPRKLLAFLGYDLKEMENTGKASLCCGTSCWTACGQTNKRIQVARLEQAKATGAALLVTTCLKCQIHFRCAQLDSDLHADIGMDIRDITTLAAERLARDKDNTSAINKDYAASFFT
jgi:Fe-S oxidoreductase